LNNLLGGDPEKMSASEKEARKNLVGTLIIGLAAGTGQNAATANAAAQIEMENNRLTADKIVEKYKKLSAAKSPDEIKKIIAFYKEKDAEQHQTDAYFLLKAPAMGPASADLKNEISALEVLASRPDCNASCKQDAQKSINEIKLILPSVIQIEYENSRQRQFAKDMSEPAAELLLLAEGGLIGLKDKFIGWLGRKATATEVVGVNTTLELKSLTQEQIIEINKKTSGGGVPLTGSVDTVLANMSYREGFENQAAAAIRDIAGSHLFQDGNKRTAQAVVELFAKENGVKIDSQALRAIIDEAGKGSLGNLSTVDAISQALKKAVKR
ncbi:Prophage maintenance system killer protein, partial [Formivibrio citricus]